MLTKVEARTLQGAVLSMDLYQPSMGAILTNVGGLDPVKASLISTTLANIDGARYRTGRREARNLRLSFDLEPDYLDYTVQDVRRRLYQFFMPKASVSFRLYDDSGVTYDISGRVESCEAPLFSKEPAMDVSVMCYSPDFVQTDPVVLNETTISSYLERELNYTGSVATGIDVRINVNRDMSAFTIYNRPPDGTLRQLDFASPLSAGDILHINTNQQQKVVEMIRAGVPTSLLYAVPSTSNWITFEPGTNHYRIYAEGAAVPYTITYSNRLGGL